MRILFVNQVYAPDVAASAQLLQDMAEHFAAEGHEVAVVASKSLYGTAGASLPAEEHLNGVYVRRVGAAWFGTRNLFGRGFDAAVFYVGACWCAWRSRLPGGQPEVIVTLTSPPFIGLIGTFIRLLRRGRARHVYWCMDLYPAVLSAARVIRPHGPLDRAMRFLNRGCMRRADRVVVLGRCMRDRVLRQGVKPENIEIAGVWSVSPTLDGPVPGPPSSYRAAWGLRGRFVVMYSGNLGLAHDARTFCAAARQLRDREDICFVIAGGGERRQEVSRFVREHGLTNVIEKGYEPRENLADLLRLGDVHLISQAEAFTGVVVPCKLFGIMASGRGALYVGPADAEVARVLREEDCGQTFARDDAAGLARAIADLADDPARLRAWGERARDAARTRHGLADRTARWEALLRDVTRPIGAPAPGPAPAAAAAGWAPAPAVTRADAADRDAPTPHPPPPPPPQRPLSVLLINQAYAPDTAATGGAPGSRAAG